MKKLFAWSALILLMLVCFSAGLCALGKSDIYFFGDSTTAHLAVRGGIPRERVWSGQARTVLFETVNKTRCVWLEAENRNYKIAEAAAKIKPPILVITLGVSGGAGRLGEQRFKSIYRELIVSVREASPETHIFVQSILPLSDRSAAEYRLLTKDAVLRANIWIRELCLELGVPYIDTHPLLLDTNGYLKKIYQNDGHMHLTRAAYSVVLENIYNCISSELSDFEK